MCNLPFAKSRSRPDRSQRKAKLHKRIVSTNYAVPTGALDYNTGKAILKLLQEMCREKGMTVIVITHNSALAPMADRLIKIKNGKVSSMKVNENPISIDEIEW